MPARKLPSVLALEFGPSTVRFVEMAAAGNPEHQVLSAGVVALESGADLQTHVTRLRAVLASLTQAPSGTVIASVPLRHAFLRILNIPEGTTDVPAAVRWDMEQYLARPLDWYALDYQPLDQSLSDTSTTDEGSQPYLAAAYRLNEVETLLTALHESGIPAPTILDIDALAIVNVFAVNYPECLPEATLIIKADALATTLFRTQNGSYLGSTVQRENIEIPFYAMEPQDRAEHLLHRARMIALGLGGALGTGSNAWKEPERVFLCGDLAGDADFRELLKTEMLTPFALLNPFRRIPGPNPDTHPGAYPGAPFAATVGLALRAVAERRSAVVMPEAGAIKPLQMNLLRHLAVKHVETPQNRDSRHAPKIPKPVKPKNPADAGKSGKRILVALTILILAVVAGLVLKNPAWVRAHLSTAPKTATLPDADSLQRALESEASLVIASQQRVAIAWMREIEIALPGSNGQSTGIQLSLSAFTAPDAFLLRGVASSAEILSRLQETLVLVPGLELRRSELRAIPHTRGTQEFLFAGAFTTAVDTTAVQNRVLSRDAVEGEIVRFLDAAAFTGIQFARLPAAPHTSAGTFQAIPFHLTASCPPALLREFLENEFRRDSPFGIQRVMVDSSADSLLVFLDIMAFSR